MSNSNSQLEDVVAGWLGEPSDEVNAAPATAPAMDVRSGRVGLGAEFLPHSKAAAGSAAPALSGSEKIIAAKLAGKRRQSAWEGDSSEDEKMSKSTSNTGVTGSDDDDMEDSVYALKTGPAKLAQSASSSTSLPALGGGADDKLAAELAARALAAERKRAKNKRRRARKAAGVTGSNSIPLAGSDGTVDGPNVAKLRKKPAGPGDVWAAGKDANAVVGGVEKRKKKKTRSKQKNLKRDTRPRDKKPTYLTPGAADFDPDKLGGRAPVADPDVPLPPL